MSKQKTEQSAGDVQLKVLSSLQQFADTKAEEERQREVAKQKGEVAHKRQKEVDVAWEKLASAIQRCIHSKASSKGFVESIQALEKIAGDDLDDKIEALDQYAWPTFADDESQKLLQICIAVTDVWASIRFRGVEETNLIAALDKNDLWRGLSIKTRSFSFVRHVIEAGGFPTCHRCNRPKTPTEIDRAECRDCRNRIRTSSLYALGIEIRTNKDSDCTDSVTDRKFPQWASWRRHLLEYIVKPDASDIELWYAWLDYAKHERAVDPNVFLSTCLEDAEAFLPGLQKPKKIITGGQSQRRTEHQADWDKEYEKYRSFKWKRKKGTTKLDAFCKARGLNVSDAKRELESARCRYRRQN